MEKIKKIKTALICHFSNEQTRKQLPLDNRKFYAFVRQLLGMPAKNNQYADIAPWTSQLIEYLSNRKDIELHVISAQTGLKKMRYSFELKNVKYHFVKADFTTLMKRLIKNDSLWRKLNPMCFVVKKIVEEISPDIVNLVGAENAYISGTILDIHRYPIFVLCQTIYNNPDRLKYGAVDSKNSSTERLIFEKENYFGVYSKMHYDLLVAMKPDAKIFDFNWPATVMPEVKKIDDKKYDFINFAASLSFNKGFHDSLYALAIVKRSYHEVKLNVLGGGDTAAKQELASLIEKLGLQDNVVFTPFFEKQEDMFQHLQYSKFAVLPCKMDNISGTMIQSMYYELPLVVYKTTGTPSLNRDKECVLISEHSNVESLAANMLILMNNPKKAENLKQNAKEYVSSSTDNLKIMDRIVSDYRAVIEHYHHNTEIPQNLLFT